MKRRFMFSISILLMMFLAFATLPIRAEENEEKEVVTKLDQQEQDLEVSTDSESESDLESQEMEVELLINLPVIKEGYYGDIKTNFVIEISNEDLGFKEEYELSSDNPRKKLTLVHPKEDESGYQMTLKWWDNHYYAVSARSLDNIRDQNSTVIFDVEMKNHSFVFKLLTSESEKKPEHTYLKDFPEITAFEVSKGSQAKDLSQAKFGIYDLQGDLVKSFTTDADGNAMIMDLPYGKFTLKQLETAAGLKPSSEELELDLLINGEAEKFWWSGITWYNTDAKAAASKTEAKKEGSEKKVDQQETLPATGMGLSSSLYLAKTMLALGAFLKLKEED